MSIVAHASVVVAGAALALPTFWALSWVFRALLRLLAAG